MAGEVVFGIFADPHFGHRNDDAQRCFSDAARKMRRCFSFFECCGVQKVICLGDLIDAPEGVACDPGILEELRDLLRMCPGEFYFCNGNHDADAGPREKLLRVIHTPLPQAYGSFDVPGIHIILLDTSFDAYGRRMTRETMQWDQLYLGDEQLEWLAEDLKRTDRQTVVFTHGNLDPRMSGTTPDPHVVKDAERARHILKASGRVSLVIQGHCHTGAQTVLDGIRYYTMRALVERGEEIPVLLLHCADSGKPEVQLCNAALPGRERRNYEGE